MENVENVDNFRGQKRRARKIVFLIMGRGGKISTNFGKGFSEEFVDIVDSYF